MNQQGSRTALLACLGWAALPLVACGPGDPPAGPFPDRSLPDATSSLDGGVDGPGSDALESELVTDGTWLLWAETSTCVGVGNLGIHGLTEALGIVELSQDADGVLHHEFRKCHVEQTPILGMATTIPDVVPRTVPVRSYAGLLDGPTVGSSYQSQRDIELWGLHLSEPGTEALPDDPSDPRVFDQDGDGNPAVTLVLGNDTCQMYVVQRGVMRWKGQVVSSVRIEGGGSSTSQQVALASTGGFCASAFQSWFPPDDARFALIRVDGRHGSMNLDSDGDQTVSCDEASAYGVEPFAPRAPDNELCAEGPPSP